MEIAPSSYPYRGGRGDAFIDRTLNYHDDGTAIKQLLREYDGGNNPNNCYWGGTVLDS